jgi:hypothetical protein
MSDKLNEIADRCRRIETRLTKYMEAQGFDAQTRKPKFKDGAMYIPSLDASLRDVLAALPPDWLHGNPVELVHKDDHVMWITTTNK